MNNRELIVTVNLYSNLSNGGGIVDCWSYMKLHTNQLNYMQV